MAETLTVTAEVELPRPPNFMRYQGGTIPVGDLSDEDLRRIGEAWTEALLQRAREQREEGAT